MAATLTQERFAGPEWTFERKWDGIRLGRDLTALPLEGRRAVLGGLPLRAPLARVATLPGDKPWERACREGWEGVIAKRHGSLYEYRRSPHWLNLRPPAEMSCRHARRSGDA